MEKNWNKKVSVVRKIKYQVWSRLHSQKDFLWHILVSSQSIEIVFLFKWENRDGGDTAQMTSPTKTFLTLKQSSSFVRSVSSWYYQPIPGGGLPNRGAAKILALLRLWCSNNPPTYHHRNHTDTWVQFPLATWQLRMSTEEGGLRTRDTATVVLELHKTEVM